MLLHIDVVNKIATYRKRDGYIVCGNSGYQIQFAFDSEWNAYSKKTARFIWNGEYTDVDFTGNTCAVPVLHNITELTVGVYAGDLSTTTPAVIDCYRSILCEGVRPSVENDRSYLNEAKEAADRAEAAAKAAEDAAIDISEEFDSRLKVLEEWMADENYTAITASLSVSPSSAEMGASVTNAKLTWSTSKETSSITLDGVSVSGTSYTDTNTYESNKTWTLKATETDRGAVATATAKLTFKHRVYWGVGTIQTGFDSDFVKALASSQLATSKAITINVKPNSEYIYYAVPRDLCGTEPTFVIDKSGFAGGFEYREETTVTNSYGADIAYYVYRSDQLLVGSTRVDVS